MIVRSIERKFELMRVENIIRKPKREKGWIDETIQIYSEEARVVDESLRFITEMTMQWDEYGKKSTKVSMIA